MDNVSTFALFPGQGAQSVGMGKSFFDSLPTAQERFQEADDTLSIKLSQICFEGPMERLTQTEITQPALLTVSVIAFEAWRAQNPDTDIRVGAGHSLGEYSALVASGALAFRDAVMLVHNRGKFMQGAVKEGEGSMIAVLGKELSEIEAAITDCGETTVQIANINAPGQVVLAGRAEDVTNFCEQHSGWKIRELQVSAPFHCSLMKPAEEQLAPLLEEVAIQAPRFPIVQNVTATLTDDPATIRKNLVSQVCGSVRWVECIETAVRECHVTEAIEFGSGKVLTGLMKRINKSLATRNVCEFEDAVSHPTE